jgi:glycosyltransferase involved in cell wall biosynthesis
MKKISILIPTYNEEGNIEAICKAVIDILLKELSYYDYEIIIIDNCSTDNTRPLIRKLCAQNPKIKAIFNTKNFGFPNSSYHGLCQMSGDCIIPIVADFQTPLNLLPSFVREWEAGYKLVIGIKTSSKESKFMWLVRTIYYKLLRTMSSESQLISHFMGYGLYDKRIIEILRESKDPLPFFKGILLSSGYKRKEVFYEQPERKSGKSSYSLMTYYNEAMLAFTSYPNIVLRTLTIISFLCSALSLMTAFGYLIYKLLFWDKFLTGTMPVLLGIFFFGSLQLFFIGFLSEYIMAINTRIMNRPLAIEEERINF